jgi:hypothetical protein
MPKRLIVCILLGLTALWQVPAAWTFLRSETLRPEGVLPLAWVLYGAWSCS